MNFFVFLIGIIIAYVLITRYSHGKQQKELRSLYDMALRSGNKYEAYDAAKSYYTHLRKGKLTMYDEQEIVRDMIAMNQLITL